MIFPAEAALKAVVGLAAILLLAVGFVLPRVELKAERLAHEQTKRQYAEERARLLAAAREHEITMQRAVARAQGDLDEARRSIRLRDQPRLRAHDDEGAEAPLCGRLGWPRRSRLRRC